MYEHFDAQQAFKLSQRFEFHYTPKASSWLNMIERVSALAKQCLHRRIVSQEKLSEEVEAIVKQRNDKAIKINWQFSIQTARTKMNSCYSKVNEENKIYK